jgi:hypothetical protein
MATMRIIDHVAGMGQTVGLATADLITYPAPPNSTAGGIFVVGIGKDQNATPNLCSRALFSRYRVSSGGTLTMPGAVQTASQFTDLALLTTDMTVLVSGGNIIVRASGGLLAATIDWWCDMWLTVN